MSVPNTVVSLKICHPAYDRLLSESEAAEVSRMSQDPAFIAKEIESAFEDRVKRMTAEAEAEAIRNDPKLKEEKRKANLERLKIAREVKKRKVEEVQAGIRETANE